MVDAYIRVVDYCVKNGLELHEFERRCNLSPFTIDNWRYEEAKLKDFIKVCLKMGVSPFWLESGKILSEYSYKEQCIIYILRNTDIEGYNEIINTVMHQAFRTP